MLKKIFILIVIILIFNIFYYKYKHKYWSKQPVSKWYYFNYKDSYIADKIPEKYLLPRNTTININKFSDKTSMKLIYDFLNDNYEISKNDILIDYNFFLWTLNTTLPKKSIILSLKKNGNIIGSITSNSINLIINSNIISTRYVDYLCVDKNCREKNMAPILISNMANIGFDNKNKSFIFQIENKQLPFRYITKYNFYYLEKKDFTKYKNLKYSNIKKINKNNLFLVYKYYCNYCKNNFDLYQLYTLSEFQYYFLNDFCTIYYYEDFGKIKGLICFYGLQLKNKKIYNQIKFIFSEKNDILLNLMNFCLDLSKTKDFIVISDTGNNEVIIKSYNFIKDITIFFQMYNYHIKKKNY